MNNAIPTTTELIDLFWRALWTALQAFSGGLVAIGTGAVDITAIEAGKIAAIAAVAALIKTYASNKLGTGTATERGAAPAGLPQPVASDNATPAGTP